MSQRIAASPLMQLIGDWEGRETTAPSAWGRGGPSIGRSTFRAELDGRAIFQDYRQLRDEAVSYRATGILMASEQSDELLWWWFDTVSGPPLRPAVGRWIDGALCFRGSSDDGAMRYLFRIGADEYTFEMRASDDAAAEPSMSGRYERRADRRAGARNDEAQPSSGTAPPLRGRGAAHGHSNPGDSNE